jgi:hypothetical protein
LLPGTGNDDVQLRHGYTVAQARSICLGVVKRQTWYHSIALSSHDQRVEVAWHAIIEHLYASDRPPSPVDLMQAASRAVNADVHQAHQFHGRNTHDRSAATIIKGFERYWWSTANTTPSPEPTVTEHLALTQIWPKLSPLHQTALAALATHGDHEQAAASLGISRKLFSTQLSDARKAFLAHWHEGESPSRVCAGKTSPARRRARRARRAAEGRQPPRRTYTPRPRPKADLGISDAELVRRYRAGESMHRLAAALGINYSTVRNRLLAEGTQLRPPPGPPSAHRTGPPF